MGRGRAKAKQTKVARELKYSGGHLDPRRLKAALAPRAPFPVAPPPASRDDADEFQDPHADAVDDEDDTAR